MVLEILFLVINCLCSSYEAAKLPSDIGLCKIHDPGASVCLAKNMQDALQKLKNGVPQLGVPKLDPLRITKMVIGEGTSAVNVVQDFENIDLYGIPETLITKARLDYDNKKLYAESISPELRLIGDYNLDGKILVLPIRGKGRFNISLENAKISHVVSYQEFTKKGQSYWKVIDFVINIITTRMHFQFDNLFGGDERLGNEINKVLNENWDVVFNDVKSGYEESLGLILKSVTDSVFNRVPIKDIFLQD